MAEKKPKKTVATKSSTKKQTSSKPKKTVSSKPKVATRATSKKTTKKNIKKINNSISINLSSMPKRIKLEGYTCIWKMYLIVDKKTKVQHKKRFWIVIGDGHKWYRKFETQAEAVHYFRRLKKYAKMRVQTIKSSKQFIKTVYTFYEMIHRGIDLDELKKHESQSIEWDENEDYVDIFDSFDSSAIEEEEIAEDNEFSEEEINKIIAENEKDAIIVEDETENEESQDQTEDGQHVFITDVIQVDESQKADQKPQKVFTITHEQEIDNLNDANNPYALTREIEFENDTNEQVELNENITNNVLVNQASIDNTNTNSSLYDLSAQSENQELVEPEVEDEDDFEITQHQTTLVMPEEDLSKGHNDTRLRKYYWLILILISIILSFIVVISILTATNVIK